MTTTRRTFLHTAAGLGAAAGLAPVLSAGAQDAPATKPTAPKKLLILGGTSFLGRHIVESAVARGHTMTLFNRQRTNAHLFPELEKLKGDRDGDLSALEGRTWDAVIDTSGYVPRLVTDAATLLADAVEQYVFISSISVYPEFSTVGLDESAPVATMDDPTNEEVGRYYGALKALCEAAAERALPGRTTSLRPGLIVGPHDNVPRFTYWPVRIARGGDVLAPGRPNDPVQYIDARDLAEFTLDCIERKTVGVFNTNGPPQPTTIGEVLYGIKAVTTAGAQFTWADADFLAARNINGWSGMPLWVPPTDGYEGFHRVNCDKAIAAGLTARPLATTARDTLAWYETMERLATPVQLRAGITAEAETAAIAAWAAHAAESGT